VNSPKFISDTTMASGNAATLRAIVQVKSTRNRQFREIPAITTKGGNGTDANHVNRPTGWLHCSDS